MVVRFGMPPTDIRPGFQAAMRSAGNRLPDGASGGGAGASCAKRLVFKSLVVGSEAKAAPFAAPQTIMMASATGLKFSTRCQQNVFSDFSSYGSASGPNPKYTSKPMI